MPGEPCGTHECIAGLAYQNGVCAAFFRNVMRMKLIGEELLSRSGHSFIGSKHAESNRTCGRGQLQRYQRELERAEKRNLRPPDRWLPRGKSSIRSTVRLRVPALLAPVLV